MHLHGVMKVNNTSNNSNNNAGEFVEGTSTSGSLLSMDNGTEVKISGNLSSYSHKSDSGSTMTKMFCSNCGSLMFGRNSAKENIMSIRAGTVIQLDLIKPEINVFMDSKVPSTSIDNNIKKAARMPL